MLKLFWQCVLGPEIYRVHHNLPTSEIGRNYAPSLLEQHTQKPFTVINTTKNILYYTIPVWSLMLYRRGYFTIEYGTIFLKSSIWFAAFYFGLMIIRGLGRSNNQEYVDFITILEDSKRPYADQTRKKAYDFDFSHWPVDFSWDDGDRRESPPDTPPYHFTGRLQKIKQNNSIAKLLIQGLPCEILSYLVSHGFGLSLIYPGSTAVLNGMINPALREGRNKLIENFQGKRAKLLTRDGNHIDTVFVDRRNEGAEEGQAATNNGQILVIGCEGNAGFYEVGVMMTPLEVGYSALGWNHPGFGESTGSPSPAEEINAIDVVTHYAIQRLNFKPENIIMFGWSIGGFSAIHAGNLYPNIGSLFLDATFDDIVPLAVKAMPPAFENIVTRTIRGYINLHHSELIKKYSGPVHFVRREMDEVMNKDGQRVISSNCANPLLHKFLLHRFPMLFGTTDEDQESIKGVLDIYLNMEDDVMRAQVMSSYDVDEEKCERILKSYITKHSAEYPVLVGENLSLEARQQLVLYLASKHMSCFQSTHCPPLPGSMFVKPWDIKDLQDAGDVAYCSSDEFEIINGDNKL